MRTLARAAAVAVLTVSAAVGVAGTAAAAPAAPTAKPDRAAAVCVQKGVRAIGLRLAVVAPREYAKRVRSVVVACTRPAPELPTLPELPTGPQVPIQDDGATSG